MRANPSGGASARELRELLTRRDLQRGLPGAQLGALTPRSWRSPVLQYFAAHPELWLPLVVVALALAGVVQLGRWARAAADEALAD